MYIYTLWGDDDVEASYEAYTHSMYIYIYVYIYISIHIYVYIHSLG